MVEVVCPRDGVCCGQLLYCPLLRRHIRMQSHQEIVGCDRYGGLLHRRIVHVQGDGISRDCNRPGHARATVPLDSSAEHEDTPETRRDLSLYYRLSVSHPCPFS